MAKTHTIYGEFSSTFQQNRLADLCVADAGIQTGPFGSQLHSSDYVKTGTPIITVQHLLDNRIDRTDLPRVSEADRARLSKYTIREGDIVLSRVGSVDRRSLVRGPEDGWLFSGRCLRVRPDPSKLDPQYLSYFFGMPAFREHIRAISVGATMPSLNTTILSNVTVVYPPLSEQRIIAAFLEQETSKIDTLVTKKEQLIELLQEKRSALISQVVTKGLEQNVPMKDSGIQRLGAIPAHWQMKRLKYSAPFRTSRLDHKSRDAIYVGLENIEPWTGKLFLDEQTDTIDGTVVIFSAGDVLFGKLRPYLAKSARPDFAGVATSEILALCPQARYLQSYVWYCLLSRSYILWLDTLAYGAKMPRVSPDEVAGSFMPFPPFLEQRAITALLDRETSKIDDLVAKVKDAIMLLKERRTTLISATVTGKIDVRETVG